MKSKFDSISIEQIYKKIRKHIINYEDGYLAIDDDELMDEYENFINSLEGNKSSVENIDKIYDFFKEHENKLNKGILVLAALERYFLMVRQNRSV